MKTDDVTETVQCRDAMEKASIGTKPDVQWSHIIGA